MQRATSSLASIGRADDLTHIRAAILIELPGAQRDNVSATILRWFGRFQTSLSTQVTSEVDERRDDVHLR